MANTAPGEPLPGSKADIVDVPTISHTESSQAHSKWKSAEKIADGDTAMTLFDNPDELHEEIDPVEARKLLWKIDFMILPYLAVCYAFFYIDKTTLSYAAIFGIRDDLHLHGTQYNWLSSIFYFGFLVWAFPTNFLMQRLPIGISFVPGNNLKCFTNITFRKILGGQHLHVVSSISLYWNL